MTPTKVKSATMQKGATLNTVLKMKSTLKFHYSFSCLNQ